MTSIRPFKINVSNDKLFQIQSRLCQFNWDALPDLGGWSGGTCKQFMQDLTAYWRETYDWREQEKTLNEVEQYIAQIEDVEIHFFHFKGSSNARPLLLLHGWPGSSYEFFNVAKSLASPETFGGHETESFDVIVPCVPGYGFSGPITRPVHPRKVAGIFNTLMVDVLGYQSYLVQGGDWGSAIASWIGFDFSAFCAGVHLNMLFMQPQRPPYTSDEISWSQQFIEGMQRESAYAQLQGTKPQTLAFAMVDNPIGVAAWIVKKFAAWSDLPETKDGCRDLLSRYGYDQLLTNIMFYVATDKFPTSIWLYYALMSAPDAKGFPAGKRCETPVGVAAFPDPVFPPMPRSLAEQSYNIVHWNEMSVGGHFAALEQPDLFVKDIRAFARILVVKN